MLFEMIPLVVGLVALDSVVLASGGARALSWGLRVSQWSRELSADAPAFEPQALAHLPSAGARILDEGAVAIWHSPMRVGTEYLLGDLPVASRVLGMNLVSAVVRRADGVQVAEIRLRLAVAVLLALAVGIAVWSWMEGTWVGLPVAVGIAAYVLLSVRWAYGEVKTYVFMVARPR